MGSVASLDGFSVLYSRHLSGIVRSVRPIVGDAAVDVAQEAFLAAFEQWERVGSLDSPAGWVGLVARRIALRRRYREVHRPAAPRDREGSAPSSTGLDADMRRALGELSGSQRTAIALRYFGDLSVGAVADVLGCGDGAARVLLHRARERLEEPLSGLRGTWIGERRWDADAICRQLAVAGHDAYRDVVVANAGRDGVRHTLSLDAGRYLLANDDGERLDHGTFRFAGDRLELTPWHGIGTVEIHARSDGDLLRIRQVNNNTPPTDNVPDHVYMKLFLEAEPLKWSGSRAGTTSAAEKAATIYPAATGALRRFELPL